MDGTGLASADTLHRIDIAAVKSEVEVIGGDKDIVTRLEASQKISAAIPDARLQVVEGVNHMGFLERAEIYNEAIAGFATSVQRVPESIPVSA